MRRHDLVYLRSAATLSVAAAPSGSPLWFALQDWLARGLPLVLARQPHGQKEVVLGVTLYCDGQRHRVSMAVNAGDIAGLRAPVTVAVCRPRLSPLQSVVLEALVERLSASRARVGVYGSLAWEVLSGETCRRADSDIDLVVDLAPDADLIGVLDALRAADAALPCALDGEARFPDGSAVAWREIDATLHDPSRQVLVKTLHDARLSPLADLLATVQTVCDAA